MQPETVQVEERTFDTGEFSTELYDVGSTNPTLEKVKEVMGYGTHLLMPYEVDPAFDQRGRSGTALVPGLFALWLGEGIVDVLEAHEEQYMGGLYMAARDGGTRRVGHTIIRLSSPTVANEVAAQMNDVYRNLGIEDGTLTPVPHTIPAYPELNATRIGGETHAVVAQDEFVLILWMYEPTEPDAPAPDLSWQDAYAAAFLDAQLPIIPQIPTQLTADGYGNTPGGIPRDPEDMLRYTVERRQEDVGIVPASVDPHYFASNYDEPRVIRDMLDRAGVDAMATNLVNTLRASNEQAASTLADEWRELDLERGFKTYEEPQGLPNTVCITKDDESGVIYDCTMQYGRYLAMAARKDYYTKPEDDNAQYELSQMMAAQYEIFKQR